MGIGSYFETKRKNEIEITGSDIKELDINIYEVSKSICKIYIKFSNKNLIGSGFFIKLYIEDKPLFCLMTNEHLIKKEVIQSKELINIYYNNGNKNIKFNLNKNERYIEEYTNIGVDITIVQILSNDNINADYFLLPNLDYVSEYNELKNRKIYILQ